MAEKFCQRALEQEPDCPRALELSAALLLERGEVERAQHCLGRAITVQVRLRVNNLNVWISCTEPHNREVHHS